jgi:hypothetical protein
MCVLILLAFLDISLAPFFHRLLIEAARPHPLNIPASLVATPHSAAYGFRSGGILDLGILVLIFIR